MLYLNMCEKLVPEIETEDSSLVSLERAITTALVILRSEYKSLWEEYKSFLGQMFLEDPFCMGNVFFMFQIVSFNHLHCYHRINNELRHILEQFYIIKN